MAKAKINPDTEIDALFEIVNQKKKEIEKIEKPTFITNCSFGFMEDSGANRINLQMLNDLKIFVSILAFLNEKENSFNIAKEELGLTKLEFTWLGFSVQSWKEDIQSRIAKIQVANKKKELEEFEKRLNAMISPEKRVQLELESIKKSLLS